jgi:hypothetical protein
MASRMVRPETTTLQISGGDWLLVKKRLNNGEQRAMFARMYLEGSDGALHVNPLQTGISKVLAYLVDWSLTDLQGKQIVILNQSIDAVICGLDAIDPDSFAEIKTAIETHEAAMRAEREQEKNAQAGETTSAATSPSLSAAGGVSSGSGNSTSMITTS